MTYAGSPGSTSGHGNGAPVSDSNRASHPSRRNVNDKATSPLTITKSIVLAHTHHCTPPHEGDTVTYNAIAAAAPTTLPGTAA